MHLQFEPNFAATTHDLKIRSINVVQLCVLGMEPAFEKYCFLVCRGFVSNGLLAIDYFRFMFHASIMSFFKGRSKY